MGIWFRGDGEFLAISGIDSVVSDEAAIVFSYIDIFCTNPGSVSRAVQPSFSRS